MALTGAIPEGPFARIAEPLFCDAFAACHEGEQYREMCGLRTNHG